MVQERASNSPRQVEIEETKKPIDRLREILGNQDQVEIVTDKCKILICSWQYHNQGAMPENEDAARELYVIAGEPSANLYPDSEDGDLFIITKDEIVVASGNDAKVSQETSFGLIKGKSSIYITIPGEDWGGEEYDELLNMILNAIGENSSSSS